MLRIVAYSLICLAVLVMPASAAMSGSFEERGDTSGATLRIAIDRGHVTGQLRLSGGKTYRLNGEHLGASIQGALKMDETVRAYFFAEETASALRLQFIPQTSEKKPDIGKARLYVFVPKGTQRTGMKEPVGSIKPAALRPSVVETDVAAAGARLPLAPPRR